MSEALRSRPTTVRREPEVATKADAQPRAADAETDPYERREPARISLVDASVPPATAAGLPAVWPAAAIRLEG